MPADLRITQLLTDPNPPEAMASFFFNAECVNVGDEASGPFVVRFELDQDRSQELGVDNLAPQESTWVTWPYDDGLGAGDHFVYCVVDATDAVPEPEAQHNQQSLYFKVAEIEFGPADARAGEEGYDEEALANEVIDTITERVNHWLPLAIQAVDEWEKDAKLRIAEYNDADATVDPAPVIAAFGEAVVRHLPGMATALGLLHDASDLIGMVHSHMGTQHMGLAGARARLEAAVDEIQLAAGAAIRETTDGFEDRLRTGLATDNPESPLHTIESASTEPKYVAELADWLGFPDPNTQNTTEPIKASMMAGLESVMEDVNRQLFREVT
jgi:hypothetical protein